MILRVIAGGCATLLTATALIIGGPQAEFATADEPSSPEPSPQVSVAPGPDEGTKVADAPVLDVDAPVFDITMATADVQGTARMEDAPDKVRVTLDATVLFGKDSADLRKAAEQRILEVAKELADHGPGKLDVIGYTDNLGSAQHGLVLSRQRAKAVAGVLREELDTSKVKFTVVGKGEADPAVPNDSEKNRKLNRRVELTFKPS